MAVGHTGKEGWVGRGAGEETMRFGLVKKKKKRRDERIKRRGKGRETTDSVLGR